MDIVERISNRPNDAPMPTEHLLDEAADEIERLRGACGGLLGLLQLIASRSDCSDDLKQILATNHRVVEARRVMEQQ